MIDKSKLLSWLKNIDEQLNDEIIIVAVGGTAMTLLNLKSSTIDVDFCLENKNKKEFKKFIGTEFKVDIFIDGYIFSEQLPDDYIEKSKDVIKLNKIYLKALNPIDIIITKSARLNARDEEDIESLVSCVDKYELKNRFEQVISTYAGKEEIYRGNFNHILSRFFN